MDGLGPIALQGTYKLCLKAALRSKCSTLLPVLWRALWPWHLHEANNSLGKQKEEEISNASQKAG